mgnify:CR=1 FL=1
MPISRTIKVGLAVVGVAVLAFAGRQGQRYYKKNLAAPRSGEVVYRQDCMSCHGPVGQGVAGKADEPLVGEKSIASLARYIAREMPENDPGTLSMADATASAEYIHQAFYSAEARARNHPPRIELAHLTVRQYRESIADLLGSLRGVTSTTESGGLAGVYRERPERDPKMPDRNRPEATFKKQVDPVIDFDFGDKAPEKGKYAAQFSINWSGSVLAPDTGAMRLFERAADLRHDARRTLERHRPLGTDHLREVPADEVLHHEIAGAVIELAEQEHPRRVRVRELAHRPRLCRTRRSRRAAGRGARAGSSRPPARRRHAATRRRRAPESKPRQPAG